MLSRRINVLDGFYGLQLAGFQPTITGRFWVSTVPGTAHAKEPLTEKLPLEERIRRRAYELYVLRGNQPGSDLDDWPQAEEEIRRADEQQA